MRALDRGGTLAVAGIHLTDIPPLHYATDLFQERQLRSVTANTRATARSSWRSPPRSRCVRPSPCIRSSTPIDALADLAADRVNGAAVIDVSRRRPRA